MQKRRKKKDAKRKEKKKHAKFKILSTKDQYMFQLTPLK